MALDDLLDLQTKNKVDEAPLGFSREDIAQSDEDIEDLVFQRNILPERTGVFDLDFPESPKQSKNKGGKGKVKKSLPLDKVTEGTSSNCPETVSESISKCHDQAPHSESECTPDELDINGNIRPSGVSSHTKQVAVDTNNSSESETAEGNSTTIAVNENAGGMTHDSSCLL